MKIIRLKNMAVTVAFMFVVFLGLFIFSVQNVSAATDFVSLDQYPGIKSFDFSTEPTRETIPESIKVDSK